MKRVKPDVFGWNEMLVTGGFLSPSGSAPNVDPIGGLVTGSFVALVFHKALLNKSEIRRDFRRAGQTGG